MPEKFKKLEDYGLIGNLETVALVSKDGSIDWCCFPHLDSPSMFAAILDSDVGGHFSIKPVSDFISKQKYIEDTNLLQTIFSSPLGSITLTDFLPIINEKNKPHLILRKVTANEGDFELRVSFKPRFDYARAIPTFSKKDNCVIAAHQEEKLFLLSPIPLEVSDNEASGQFRLEEGQSAWFALSYNERVSPDIAACENIYKQTKQYWDGWMHRCGEEPCIFAGPWHDQVVRSALALKLLIHQDTGAIAAAATTSLPEEIGGGRNWDYRFAWIRDASFTIQALYNLGHIPEAIAYLKWIKSICVNQEISEIKILYGLRPDSEVEEKELPHLSGYKNSAPVRIGNGASGQRQLDIYGELVNAFYETSRYSKTLTPDDWQLIRMIADYVCENWQQKDSGIWEVRGGLRHYTYSKLMCWVALDRSIKMAEEREFFDLAKKWNHERETIREAILTRGFNETINSFVQAFDSQDLDATSLLIPLMGFLPIDDPRVSGTIKAAIEQLMVKGLVMRYRSDDGLAGEEGAFVLCTCWLVDALCLSGQVEKAKEIFTNLLEHGGTLNLFAEEIDPASGEQTGNFPQAFSHIGIINSALYLGRAMGLRQMGPPPLGTEKPEKVASGGVMKKKYDVDYLVVGGGGGGITGSFTANGLGKTTAVIEKRKLGGECTWTGCIPSKALIKASHVAHYINNLEKYGLKVDSPLKLDAKNVMAHVRSVVEKVYEGERPETFESKGIKVLFGEPQFLDNHQVRIGDKTISANKILITTGSRPAIPPIPGIEEVSYLTNENIFDLVTLPDSMITIGAGPIGIELSQALNRLGVDVTVVHRSGAILKKDDSELTEMLLKLLQEEGLQILLNTKPQSVVQKNGKIVLTVSDENQQQHEITADALFTATGRKPNIEGLNLEKAGVKYTAGGIVVNDKLKTTAPNIYACGDVTGPYRFSHIAEYQAVIATVNALLPLKKNVNYRNIIWATFTDPELAHAGLTESEARDRYGDAIKVYRYDYSKLDRARTELENNGRAKFICDTKGFLLGAHILGANAGELIHEAQLLRSFDIPLSKVQGVIHAYPTYSDITRQLGKQAYIDKLQNNPFLKLLKKFTSKGK